MCSRGDPCMLDSRQGKVYWRYSCTSNSAVTTVNRRTTEVEVTMARQMCLGVSQPVAERGRDCSVQQVVNTAMPQKL